MQHVPGAGVQMLRGLVAVPAVVGVVVLQVREAHLLARAALFDDSPSGLSNPAPDPCWIVHPEPAGREMLSGSLLRVLGGPEARGRSG